MKLRQQIVHDNVLAIVESHGLPEDQAFLLFVWSLVTGQSINSLDPSDLVDGGQDKQIDVITIEESTDSATVYILQTKNTTSFASNAIIQLRNGLNWLFNKPRSDMKTLSNVSFKDRILEYRSLQSGLGPSNLSIRVVFATNGLTSEISDEFEQERKTILDHYDNQTFDQFRFEVLGADELVSMLNAQDRKVRRIDADIRIRYDANNPSLIRYFSEDLKGIVCSAPASEIARIVNEDPEGAVFDLNVRRYLGSRGAVNADIRNTCTRPDSSLYFWFLNNGITIVCDHFDAVTDPDNPHIKVKNMQIVNGCQTASTLAIAQAYDELAPDVRVLLRIYETQDLDLVDKIVLTTNNQNKISTRNLRANDPIQIDMERAFRSYGYFYERKPRQFAGQNVDTSRILPNEYVAQSYLAVVLKKPSDARGRKYKVWSEYYSSIFGGQAVEPFLVSTKISRYVAEWIKAQGLASDGDDLRRTLAKKGVFHLARIVAHLWRGGDEWQVSRSQLQTEIEKLDADPSILDGPIEDAFAALKEIISGNEEYLLDVDRALKSYALDESINSKLYS